MNRRTVKMGLIAKWVLATVLLAQAAVAMPACLMPFSPAAAIAGASGMESCDHEVAQVPALCLAQCLQSDQLSDAPGDHPAVARPTAHAERIATPFTAIVRVESVPDSRPPDFLKTHRLRL